jgi:hypothetical protein
MARELPLQRPLLPLLWFDRTDLEQANDLLSRWNHRMGPIRRPMASEVCHILVHEERPVAVTVASTLIRERVGGGLHHLTRENTVELSRLCAERSGLCRVALRMWREFVFPTLGFPCAISYQDADLHNGATYRFDGWRRVGYSHSGDAGRTSSFYLTAPPEDRRKGRNKWIWLWPASETTAPSGGAEKG